MIHAPAPAQQPLGNWLPKMFFQGPWPGCNGNQAERFYGVHANVIPVGPNRGKLLIWDKSSSFYCTLLNANSQPTGNRDQRWAILDPEAQTVSIFAWTIPEAFAPPVYAPAFGITQGAQGLFCAGHCWLPDGRLLTVGGDDWLANAANGYAEYTGSRLVCVYDPAAGPNGTWQTLRQIIAAPNRAFLERARWYPSAVVCHVSSSPRTVKVSVLGGIEQFTPGPETDLPAPSNGIYLATDQGYLTHEAYDIQEGQPGQNWTITKDTRQGGTLPPNYGPPPPVPGLFIGPTTASSVPLDPDFPLGYSLFYYARAHFLSNGALGGTSYANGLVWMAGMAVDSAWIDHPTDPNTWNPPHPILTAITPILEEPTGVLLPASLGTGGEDRIALIGGQYGLTHSGAISGDVYVLDARSATPQWTSTAIPALKNPRKFADSILLPDESILVVGGGIHPGHGQPGGEVFTPEVFRGTLWEECAAESSPRTYHSCAVLLPSGRVASLGGDTSTSDVQVFEPHYFQIGGQRPAITGSPATIAYSQSFTVNYTLNSGRTIISACLIAPSSLTHSHDPNQRLVKLTLTNATSTQATMTAPLNPTKAPFGYYMLFLVDSAGAVSAAAWVQLL